MARGNWRSGKDHGVAEVGSERKTIDGFILRKSASFESEREAFYRALWLRRQGYFVRVIKGRKLYSVWRSYHKIVGWR